MMKNKVGLWFSVWFVFGFATAVYATPSVKWIPTWYASPEPAGNSSAMLANQTIRQILHVTVGGNTIRIRLSNANGKTTLKLDQIDAALRSHGSSIIANTSTPVTFAGHSYVSVAPSACVLSDPLSITVPDQSDLAISIFTSLSAAESTQHVVQRSAVYVSDGNVAGDPDLSETTQDNGNLKSWVWLDEVEVSNKSINGTVVAFGDSITDGVGTAPDTNAAWPDVLYSRFHRAGIPLSVINSGISGNRLLHGGSWPPFGIAALGRFDDDALVQPNVRSIIVLLGINDIGQVSGKSDPDFVSALEIEDALCQLAERGHEHGIKIYVGTLTPFKVTTIKNYYSDDKEIERQVVNNWIRSSMKFDGIIDFDKALEDPINPGHMLPAYDCGDHLHPSKEGDEQIANVIPLKWFR